MLQSLKSYPTTRCHAQGKIFYSKELMTRLEISLTEAFKEICKRNLKVTEDTIQGITLQFLLWFSVQKKTRNPHCECAGVLMETGAALITSCLWQKFLSSSRRYPSISVPLLLLLSRPLSSASPYFLFCLASRGWGRRRRAGEEPQRNRKCCSCKTVMQSPCFRKLSPRFFSFIPLLLLPQLFS